jgi:hypothetical protein
MDGPENLRKGPKKEIVFSIPKGSTMVKSNLPGGELIPDDQVEKGWWYVNGYKNKSGTIHCTGDDEDSDLSGWIHLKNIKKASFELLLKLNRSGAIIYASRQETLLPHKMIVAQKSCKCREDRQFAHDIGESKEFEVSAGEILVLDCSTNSKVAVCKEGKGDTITSICPIQDCLIQVSDSTHALARQPSVAFEGNEKIEFRRFPLNFKKTDHDWAAPSVCLLSNKELIALTACRHQNEYVPLLGAFDFRTSSPTLIDQKQYKQYVGESSCCDRNNSPTPFIELKK